MVYVGLALIALPFGWMLGLLIAFIWAGGADFGQLPMLTVPAGVLIGLLAAFLPIGKPATRLKTMLVILLLLFGFFSLVPF